MYALRVAIRLWTEREVKRQEEAKRDGAARKITVGLESICERREAVQSWICDRLTIRAAKKELEERRMKRNEERERMRIEEEERRKKAVGTIEVRGNNRRIVIGLINYSNGSPPFSPFVLPALY